MLDTLRRDVRSYTRLALAAYDKLEGDPAALRSRLAILHDNRVARENPVRLTETFLSATASAWEDELVISGAIDNLDYTVPMKGYHAWFAYNEINIERPNQAATLQQMIARLPKSLMDKQVRLILNIFRLNPLTVDGQNFFADAHVHINGASYDNTLDVNIGTPAAPTFDEGKTAINAALTRLAENNALEAEFSTTSQFRSDILVVAHNAAQAQVFEQIRTQTSRNNVENELKGTFDVMLDRKPASGTEDMFEVVYTPPGGARPAIFVPDRAPWLDTWKDGVRNGYVAIGMKEIFGVKPAHAFSTVRVTFT